MQWHALFEYSFNNTWLGIGVLYRVIYNANAVLVQLEQLNW